MTSLRVGSSGDQVRALQQKLLAAGFDPHGVDGQFGNNTRRAVEAYQRSKGLEVDGIAGNNTMRAIGGESGFDTSVNPAGMDHRFKQFREVDEAKLRAALPAQARDLAHDFIEAGRRNNIDPLVLVAISKHETCNWTSSAFRNKNNAMGISNRKGPVRMSSAEASIDKMAKGLADPNGYYRNAQTVGDLAKIYAAKGAANDPTGLNGHWPRGV